jgi:hypothetical protein
MKTQLNAVVAARPNAVTSCTTVVAVTMQIAGNAHSKTATLCTTAAGVTRPSARIAHSRTATACTTAAGVTRHVPGLLWQEAVLSPYVRHLGQPDVNY